MAIAVHIATSPHSAWFIEDRERERSPETDEKLDQLLSSLSVNLVLNMLSKFAPPTQPYHLNA